MTRALVLCAPIVDLSLPGEARASRLRDKPTKFNEYNRLRAAARNASACPTATLRDFTRDASALK